MIELDDSVDAILCLCCPCGIAALKRIISTIPLFGISKLKGTLAYVYKDVHKNEQDARVIIPDKSRAIIIGE